ncbi:MAG: ABC transporter ATP-binding protein [Clostridia bacterium]|nr:ABC transporter ATP-binding protein [Clostridia bacterium]
MLENLKILKTWWNFAKPNKKYFSISSIAIILAYCCEIITPLFAAKVIIAINASAWWNAVLYLTISFGFLALGRVFWHMNYAVFNKLVDSVYRRLSLQFVDKMYKAKNQNFKKTPKEKLLNILHTEIYNLGDNADKAAICLGRIFMLIVTIIIIFSINIWVGLAVIVCDIINFIVLNLIETKRSKRQKKLREDVDDEYQMFSEIITSKDMINDLNLNEKINAKFNNHIDEYIKDLGKKSYSDSYVLNGFYVFYNFLIFVLSLGAVLLTSKGAFSIETYFIIIPYITSGIETTNKVFEFMPYIKNSAIYVSRVKNVLNFVEKEEIEFGDINNDNIIGFMDFNDVSYAGDKEGNPKVREVSFRANALQTTLITGPKKSGKRTIFHLMHREIKPKSGQITMDEIDIYKYNKKVYKTNFNYLSTHPVFFNKSILYNLKIVNKDKDYIVRVLNKLNLMDYINSLPNKIYTNILTLPFDKQYLIGLARTLLTNAEIIAIYEFPSSITNDEKNNIKNIIKSLRGKRTIIIFSSNEFFVDIADKIVTIEKGAVSNISFTNNNKNLYW